MSLEIKYGQYTKELNDKNFRSERATAKLMMKMKFPAYARNKQVGCFYADFLWIDSKTILEVDGSIHNKPEIQKRDKDKTGYWRTRGFKVFRINFPLQWQDHRQLERLKTHLLGFVSPEKENYKRPVKKDNRRESKKEKRERKRIKKWGKIKKRDVVNNIRPVVFQPKTIRRSREEHEFQRMLK